MRNSLIFFNKIKITGWFAVCWYETSVMTYSAAFISTEIEILSNPWNLFYSKWHDREPSAKIQRLHLPQDIGLWKHVENTVRLCVALYTMKINFNIIIYQVINQICNLNI